ncbi:MAG: hypothetical protein ACKVS6_03345 [Planctomycetota bacterium]
MADTKTPAPAETKKKTSAKGGSPLLAILLMIVAVGGGAFVRFPEAGRLDSEKVTITTEARESVEAARALLDGNGLTIHRNNERVATHLAPGEPLAVAGSYILFGKNPVSPLYLQFLFSTGAILLIGLAGWLAAGPWGGVAAAILLATYPDQIEAARAVSAAPSLTFFGALAIFCAAASLRKATPGFVGFLVAGIATGFAASVHPLFIVMAGGLLLASILKLSGKALGGLAIGIILGLVPIALYRSTVFGNPFVSGERLAAKPGMLGYEMFQGTAGTRAADWIGVDAAGLFLNFDKGYFEHIYQNPGHAALWFVAAVGVLGILVSSARVLLILALGTAAFLLAIPLLQSQSAGLPLTRATSSFIILIAVAAAAGATLLSRIPVLGPVLAVLLGLSPAAANYQKFLEVIKSPPGLLSPKPAEPESSVPNNSASNSAIPEPATVETVKPPTPADVSTNTNQPPPVEPAAPKVSRPLKPANANDLAIVKKIIDGEGGMTKPAASMEGTSVLLTLKIDHKNIDAAMAATDAVRLSLKIFRDHPSLDHLIVKIVAADGKLVSTSRVLPEKAKPFIEKLDDPFESRRARDWWPQIRESI